MRILIDIMSILIYNYCITGCIMKIRMELIDWLIRQEKSKKKFCKKCGISERELQRLNYRNGQDNAEIILKISKATNVEVCDLYKNGD